MQEEQDLHKRKVGGSNLASSLLCIFIVNFFIKNTSKFFKMANSKAPFFQMFKP
jgi:hypothetical protein